MTEEDYNKIPVVPEKDWEKAKPAVLPKSTYWPFFLALGLTFAVWGLLTTWIIFTAGLLIFSVALFGWINQLRHE